MPVVPVYDAVILAGGRSSRLGGSPKALLRTGGRTLLETTLDAVAGARRVAVVGPGSLLPLLEDASRETVLVREEPEFGGPAAAVAAGLEALPASGDWTLVLACDMPRIASAAGVLLDAAGSDDSDGDSTLLALDADGRSQPLAGLYRTADLRQAVLGHAPGGLTNMSMKALLARVQWRGVDVPPMSTADVDTWADARILGVSTEGTALTASSSEAKEH
ncbi:molybdenum cofactor guanylyltransferase [Arthrobacter sp. zg-Y750]|uniref:molybdenum cofactor guanylyltransferase n=1 Tax=Arthrobacter sp. zg-Y750 TaxID=2894189 RepID=UPI001E3CEBB0|nr:NTP transferase domain-containing protein [Arthrobacter sp. zg-Y750]MCC9178444.1 NTP transferase domain-containing protein [Arthrobacter sp. zg-Y750]